MADVAALEEAPFTVGFAAETEHLQKHAQKKLLAKNVNMIAANQVGVEGSGFDAENNAMSVIWADDSREFSLQSKADLATGLRKLIAERYRASRAA